MDKFKTIYFFVFIPVLAGMLLILLNIKNKEDFKHKAVLAQETRKVLEHLMVDLGQARESTILDVPADGQWHNRIAFDTAQDGALEYIIKAGQLFRINKGNSLLIADDVNSLRIRRQAATPDILEVQIEAKKYASLVSNLRIRVRE